MNFSQREQNNLSSISRKSFGYRFTTLVNKLFVLYFDLFITRDARSCLRKAGQKYQRGDQRIIFGKFLPKTT